MDCAHQETIGAGCVMISRLAGRTGAVQTRRRGRRSGGFCLVGLVGALMQAGGAGIVGAVVPGSQAVFLHQLADVAAEIALGYFLSPGLIGEVKGDGSPVTDADREIEDALRGRIGREYPHDAFLGEETGAHGQGHRRWIIDALDGTASFLAGEPE
jgi:hypothetical protein